MKSVKSEKAIKNAVSSLEMEGFVVAPEYISLCEKLLNDEISMEEYIQIVKNNLDV